LEPFGRLAFFNTKANSKNRAGRACHFAFCPVAARVNRRGKVMLNWVVTLLIIALIAAVLGFGGIAMAAVGLAKIIFFVALVLFLIAVLAGSLRAV
jgi:uncharacterized membrane protein YtjA (UPF0391 family)